MKKFFRKYKHLASLLAVSIGAFLLLHFAAALFIIACYQLVQFARCKRRRNVYYTGVLTPEQIKEVEEGLKSLKTLADYVPGLSEIHKSAGGFAAIKALPDLLGKEQKRVDEIQGDVKKLRKQIASLQGTGSGVRYVGNVPFVTDDCARALTSLFVIETSKLGEKAMNTLAPNVRNQESLLAKACEFLGIEQKAALTTTEIPVPTLYMSQITELVFRFGAARQYATVYPLGADLVKLPRLKAGEDDFGFLGVGTAGMSAAITERKVTAELVTFTANKAGGLIRIPTELEEDTFIQMGQFLARYIARQLAKLEDKTVFLGDGTGTYANITGVGPYCAANAAYLTQLAAGKTKPTDATLADFRAMRTQVNAAVLSNMAANGQVAAAYYLNPTLEALLVTFNTLGAPLVYQRANGGAPATLDGFPIRWIGVSQAYKTTAAPASYLAFFGDLSFVYLGERGQVRVEVSKEVFFATDELAMRALERIDVELMAVDAMSALQLAAA